ncbi:hypothetical protein SUGI_1110360 [Cryptomeria japonica]|nr:hypothetical protein SUGI_1110360 [Cryptomeria japonica]
MMGGIKSKSSPTDGNGQSDPNKGHNQEYVQMDGKHFGRNKGSNGSTKNSEESQGDRLKNDEPKIPKVLGDDQVYKYKQSLFLVTARSIAGSRASLFFGHLRKLGYGGVTTTKFKPLQFLCFTFRLHALWLGLLVHSIQAFC